MHPKHRGLVLCLPLLLVAIAGCTAPGGDSEEAPEWTVGDVRTYRKEGTESGFFTKRVHSLVSIDGQETYEVLETRSYSHVASRSYWAVGSLRLVRQDFVEAGRVVGQEVYGGDARVFYHFPLEEGERREGAFTVETHRGDFVQTQEATWRLTVGRLDRVTVAGKVWDALPYVIEHRFPGPDNWQRVEGWYAPALGDYVRLVTEGPDYRNTYSLVDFRKAAPVQGGPLYGLAGSLRAVEVDGPLRFRAEDGASHGYIYTILPRTVEVRVAEARSFQPERGVVWVSLRPAGSVGADLGRVQELTSSRLGLLYGYLSGPADQVEDGERILVDRRGDRILLLPGQIYEVTLASNLGAVTLELGEGDFRDVPGTHHGLQVLEAVSHTRGRDPASGDPTQLALPGPQSVRDTERMTLLPGPRGRVETLVVHEILDVEQPLPDVGRLELVVTSGSAGRVEGNAVYYAAWEEATGEPARVRSDYAYEAESSIDGRYARRFAAVALYMADA